MLGRTAIAATPAAYYVNTVAGTGSPVLADPDESERFLRLLETVRAVFRARLFAYALVDDGLHLVLQIRDQHDESDSALRSRWRELATRAIPTAPRLRARLGSLSGFMQTLLQRYSRDWNRRHGTRGRVWASRYRAALLADDCAVLAAATWVEREFAERAPRSSRGARALASAPVALAVPPLLIGPGDFTCPADEAPPGCAPPPAGSHDAWLDRFADNVAPAARAAHGKALCGGWALGRPESLASVMARLARPAGRGRGRRMRDLDDELGLCGVWG